MTIFSAYRHGWKISFKYLKMWGFLYLINFLIAGLAALPFWNLMESTIGNSLVVEDLALGFDFTIISDFLNEYGLGVSNIMNQSFVLIFLFFLLYIFLTGGILTTFRDQPATFRFSTFGSGCVLYFWRFFRLSAFFGILHFLVFLLFASLYMVLIKGGSPDDLESEIPIIHNLLILFPIYVLVAMLVFLWHDYTKIQLVQTNNQRFFAPISNAFNLILSHFSTFYRLYLLNFATMFLFLLFYLFLTSILPSSHFLGIFILFLIGQLFIGMRIGMKLVNLGSATAMYHHKIS